MGIILRKKGEQMMEKQKKNKEACNKCADCYHVIPLGAFISWCLLHKKIIYKV
jgi:ferredoxin